MKPIRFPRDSNPLYPLPPDYEALTGDGQRLARLNALHLQETPGDVVAAWAFLRKFYLEPPDAGWYKSWVPSPPAHYLMVQDLATYRKNAWAAPRDFSKTTVMREVAMLFGLTRPRHETLIVQATLKKYRKSIDALKWQFENNPLLLADFGRLAPSRGLRTWSTETLRMPNGALVDGGSVSSALRGDRPDLLLIDDPEYDDEEDVEPTALMESFERLLFRVLLRMIGRGARLFWIGTRITCQSYLYVVTQEHGDPRFRTWNRRVLGLEDDAGQSTWNEKFDLEERERLKLELGLDAYEAECMNRPGSRAARVFHLHPDYGTYTVEGTPPQSLPNPLDSDALCLFQAPGEHGPVHFREVFGLFVESMFRLVTVDFIRKPSPSSDYACILVMGFDHWDTLWLLDGFLAKVAGDAFIHRIFELSMKWRVTLVGTEAVSVQEHMTDRAISLMSQLSAGTGFLPRVVPIRYARSRLKNADIPTKVSKAERIEAMSWRFRQNRIRLPLHRQEEFWCAQLFHQVAYFTPNLALLRHDDALDTLAMHQYLVRGRGSRGGRVPERTTVLDHLKAGDLVDDDLGIPHAAHLPAEKWSDEIIEEARRLKYGDAHIGPPSIGAGTGDPGRKAQVAECPFLSQITSFW